MKSAKLLITSTFSAMLVALVLLPLATMAKTEQQATKLRQLGIQINVGNKAKPGIRVKAKDVALRHILDDLAKKTGAQIHYSKLSDTPISADCQGNTVNAVMACLVSKQFSLIAKPAENNKPAEFWLVGDCESNCEAVVAATPKQSGADTDLAMTEKLKQEQIDELIKQAESKDAATRANAINSLGAIGAKDDPNVNEILRNAMADSDVNVRSQAISAIGERGGDDFENQLSLALKDKDASVRLSALGFAKDDDVSVFQQALGDSDPTVKEYAQSRLQALTAQQSQGGEVEAAAASTGN